MKNIFKRIAFLIFAGLAVVSCDYDESNYDSLLNELDPNSTYYVQFKDASKSLQTGVDESGDLVDIETKIVVVLLGPVQSQDVVVNLGFDPSSTIDQSMYELSSNSVTIPAGKTSAFVTLKTNTELMPIGELLTLKLNIDAGEHNATAGTMLSYDLFRIRFCLLELSDYVGTWTGTDSWGYSTEIVTSLNDNGDLMMNGIGFGWFQDWWGEVIVTNTPVKVNINLITGDFVIDAANQTVPYVTSTYLGDPQPAYKISANGKITSTCEQVIEFEYTWIQGGSEYTGVAWGPRFKEIIQKN